jgi:hypothetical protein
MAVSIQSNSDNTTGAVKVNGTTSFTFSTTGISLPGNATNALDAVPKQQLPKLTSLRLVASQTTGNTVKFDTAYKDAGGYWNSSTMNVSCPVDTYGSVTINLIVSLSGSVAAYKEFYLTVAGAPRSQVNITLQPGVMTPIQLAFTGPLSGLVAAEVNSISNLTIVGSNQGPTGTNFGMVTFA